MSHLRKIRRKKLKQLFFNFVDPVKDLEIFKKHPHIISSSFYFKTKEYLNLFSSLEPFLLPTHLKKAHLRRRSEWVSSRIALFLLFDEHFLNPYPSFVKEDWFMNRGKLCGSEKALSSITHSKSFVSVAISKDDSVLSLGIDSEGLNRNLIKDKKSLKALEMRISNQSEVLTLIDQGVLYEISLFLIFSAKESVYKCVSLFNSVFLFKNLELNFNVESLEGERKSLLLKGNYQGTQVSDRMNINGSKKSSRMFMEYSKRAYSNRVYSKKVYGTFKIKKINLDSMNFDSFKSSLTNEFREHQFKKEFFFQFLKQPSKFGQGEFRIESGMVHTSFILK